MPRPTSQDLAGYWDMLQLSIEDVSLKFDELQRLKLNDWKVVESPERKVRWRSGGRSWGVVLCPGRAWGTGARIPAPSHRPGGFEEMRPSQPTVLHLTGSRCGEVRGLCLPLSPPGPSH